MPLSKGKVDMVICDACNNFKVCKVKDCQCSICLGEFKRIDTGTGTVAYTIVEGRDAAK